MVISALALLESNLDPTTEEIKKGISGNLCRCTGYAKIIEAIHEAGKSLE
jgi:carbon-monoxide dehydrogenase small subunit